MGIWGMKSLGVKGQVKSRRVSNAFKGFCWSFTLGATSLAVSNTANATSAYLPEYGQLLLSTGWLYQDYDTAWQGKTFNSYKLSTRIHEYHAVVSYGITNKISFDADSGYGFLDGGLGSGTPGTIDFQNPIPQGSRDGITDSHVGFRYAAYTEDSSQWNSLPSIALYVGGLIAGNYDPRPQALGNGASGFQTGIAAGRFWSDIKAGFTADVNYSLITDNVVPDNVYGSVGVYKVLGQFYVSGAWRFFESTSGWDTGKGPSYLDRVDQAVGRQENYQLWEIGTGYTMDTGTTFSLTYSNVFDGRNTAQRETVQAYVTVPIQILSNNKD